MPHWKTMVDRDFLGACDLQGRDVICTIAQVEQGALKRAGSSKSDRKPVIRFAGKDKRFVVNATNATTISQMYGPRTEQWIGKRITLYPTTAKLKGQDVEAIRVRPTPPRSGAPDAPLAATPPTEIEANLTERSSSDPTPEEIEAIRAQEQAEAEAELRSREG